MKRQIRIWAAGTVLPSPAAGTFFALVTHARNDEMGNLLRDAFPEMLEPPSHVHHRGDAKIITISGQEDERSFDGMALCAVVKGIWRLAPGVTAFIYTTSSYVVNVINQGWLKKWQVKQWKNPDGELVPNANLWQEVTKIRDTRTLIFLPLDESGATPLGTDPFEVRVGKFATACARACACRQVAEAALEALE